MMNYLSYLRMLNFPIVKGDNKNIQRYKVYALLMNYQMGKMRMEKDLTQIEKERKAKEGVDGFLSNFKCINEGGWDIVIGLGKMTPAEMDETFGFAKNPNPGSSFLADRYVRCKENPPTINRNFDKELQDAMPDR